MNPFNIQSAPTKQDIIKAALVTPMAASSSAIQDTKYAVDNWMLAVYGSDQYTCQDVFDIFGTNAVNLMTGLELAVSLIKFYDSSYTAPFIPYKLTANADGTITADLRVKLTPPTNA